MWEQLCDIKPFCMKCNINVKLFFKIIHLEMRKILCYTNCVTGIYDA